MGEALAITNSDIASTMEYFMKHNWMHKACAPRVPVEEGEGVENIMAKPVYLAQLQNEIFGCVRRKLNLMPHTPRAVVFNSSSTVGLGLRNPYAVYDTGKVTNVIESTCSINKYCRVTTRETIASIRRMTGMPVLCPKHSKTRGLMTMHPYPLGYMECANALRKIDGEIHVKQTEGRPHEDISFEYFTRYTTTEATRKRVYKAGLDREVRFLDQMIPDLVEGDTWESSHLGRWLTTHPGTLHAMRERTKASLRQCFDDDLVVNGLSDSLAKGVLYYRRHPEKCPWPILRNDTVLCRPSLGLTHTVRATDGSYKDGEAGYGYCVDVVGTRDTSTKPPGKPTISTGRKHSLSYTLC